MCGRLLPRLCGFVFLEETTKRNVAGEFAKMFETVVDVVEWPVQRGKFKKLFNDQGETISNLGYSTSFPRNQK